MKVAMIAAVAENRAIGNGNKLIYWLPDDLKRFKQLTTGHTIYYNNFARETLNLAYRALIEDLNNYCEGLVVIRGLLRYINRKRRAANTAPLQT